MYYLVDLIIIVILFENISFKQLKVYNIYVYIQILYFTLKFMYKLFL